MCIIILIIKTKMKRDYILHLKLKQLNNNAVTSAIRAGEGRGSCV
jgi:hypothetical protein